MMPEVKMPQLGESVTEGTLGKWFKNVGDTVGKYEPLVEVITDKVNAEIPSDFEGVLAEIIVNEGDTVKVGTVICRIQEPGEVTATPEAAAGTPQTSPEMAHPVHTKVEGSQTSATKGLGRYSPAVLKLAEEKGVELARVTGTGEGGRITRKDVLRYLESGQESSQSELVQIGVGGTPNAVETTVSPAVVTSPSVPNTAPANFPTTVPPDDAEIIQPSAIRKTIARRMVESKHNAPHAWTMMEADVTSLAQFRDSVKSDFKRKEGVDLTYLPFFIKAVVEALKQFPMMNAAWVDDTIRMNKRINISIAVATDEALSVPVIHDADRLSIAGLAHAINDLAARARGGRLTIQDVQGGTFTVNNTGAFGSVLSQPIINAPQAAILSVESIVKRPVVIGDAIAIRHMVNLCLSLDHRLLDGWVAGQFLKAVKERLQSFNRDTVLF